MASNNDFMMQLAAALNVAKSKKQINSDIKQLEKTVNLMRLTATLLKGDTKKQIKEQINQIQSQLAPVKLAAKLDEKATQRAVNNALKNVKFSDIDINVDGLNLKLRKALSSVNSRIPKITIPVDYDVKKQRLQNELTTYLTKNSKIRESSGLLNESDNLKALFDKINDKKSLTEATEQFRLFKSEVQATGYSGASTTQKLKDMISRIGQIGSFFGVGAMMVSRFSDSLKTLKGNSTILTEIAKTSEMTARQIREIGDSSFGIASKYGIRSNGYLEGVREMSRSGYNELSKELGELSVLAQSAGDMTADSANNYLLATDAAYKYKGSIEQLTAALDGANYISNRNSATLTDIADGVRVSASYAAEAGVQIDELTAAEATMIATTKRSGSEMGRAFRSILLNLQQVKGEFDGEIIDEESLKKVESRCHSLGVELETMTSEGAKLRNPMEILKELSQVYNSLPDSSVDKQGIISDIGGKYHANALAALLSNWSSYEKMLGEFSQGTGSSLREAAKTAESWEGRLNALQNQWDSFVNHVTDQSTIKGGISFLETAIGGAEKLVDTLGAIPTLLTTITGAYTLLNKDYGITQITNPQSGKLDVQGNYMGINITALKAQKKHFMEAEDAIAQWNKQVVVGLNDINDFEVSVVKNNTQLKEYLATCTDGSASLAGYRASLKAAGVQTEALRLKTVLMTSAISFGLGLAIQTGISLLTKVIDEQVHAQERALEAAQEASSRIKSINDTYASHRKVVEDTAAAYEELSKGVDTATNRNISLGTEDYNKFLDINKQLADAFPELITTIDENGNAILNLGTHGRTASDDLRELLAAEEDLQNFKISQELSDVFGGVKVQVDNALRNQEEYNVELDKTQEVLKDIRNMAAGKISIGDSIDFTGDFMNEGDANKHNAYISAIQKFYKQLTPERRRGIGEMFDTSKIVQMNPDGTSFRFYLDTVPLSNEEKLTLNNLIQEQSQDIAISLSDSIGTSMQEQAEKTKEAELAWKDFLPSLVATMKSQSTFKELDETTQEIAVHLVEGLQMNVADQMDENHPYDYIRNSIIAPLYNLSKEDLSKVSDAYNKLFSLDPDKLSLDDTKKQVDGYINTIAEILGKDPIELKFQFGFNDIDSLVQNYSTIMQRAAEKFSGQTALSLTKGGGEKYESEYSDLDKFAKANSINTQNEIAFWNSCLEESKTREEAMKKYLASSNIAKQGTNLTFMDTFDKLDEMTEPLKALDEAYSNFIDKDKEITFDNLASLSDKFKDVTGIQSYIKAIQDARGNTKATQEAFNNLTSAYIEHTGILDQVNQSNASLIQSYLQEQGIAKADILVQQALAHNLAVVEAQKYLTANATFDLANATSDEIAAFIDSAETADVSKAALIELMMAKISCNETGIVTDGDIQNLIDLATAAGIAEAAIKNAKAAQNQKNAPGVARSAGADNAISESIYSNLESEIKEELYKPREYKFTGGSASNKAKSGSGGSKGSKDTSEEINHIDRLLSESEKRLKWYKNALEDAFTIDEKDSAIEKMVTETKYQLKQMNDVYSYYTKAASEKLAQIPVDMRDAVKDGKVDIETLNNEKLANLIKEFRDLDGKAEDAKDKVRDLNKSINDLAQQKIQIRIDFLEDKNEMLNKRLDKFKSLISAVVSGIEGEIDDVKDHYDSMIDRYQTQIDALELQKKAIQDQLDELNKQNEALKIQKDLEDAIYARRKAENNKNVHIYREDRGDGKSGMVWEADQDAVKDAKEQEDEASFNKKKYDLQTQIDAFDKQISALDETIEKLEKTRDSEIDYLNSIKDSWSSIEETARTIADMEMADGFWGSGWFNDIISGDTSYLDDIVEKFQTTYGAISDNQQMIDSLTGLKDNLAYVDGEAALVTANMAANFSTLGSTATTVCGNINMATSAIPVYTEENRALNEEPMLLWGEQFTTFGGQACGVADSIAVSYESMAARLEAAAERAVAAIKRIKRAERDDDDDEGYAKGTRNAKPGLHPVAEGNRPEIIIKNSGKAVVADRETYYPFSGGETVLKPEDTKSILNGDNVSPIRTIKGIDLDYLNSVDIDEMIAKFSPNIADLPRFDSSKMIVNNTENRGPSLTIGKVEMHEVNDADEFMDELYSKFPQSIGQKYYKR